MIFFVPVIIDYIIGTKQLDQPAIGEVLHIISRVAIEEKYFNVNVLIYSAQ